MLYAQWKLVVEKLWDISVQNLIQTMSESLEIVLRLELNHNNIKISCYLG